MAPLTTAYTTAEGPGGSAAQPVPANSLGGFASLTPWAGGVLHDLFNLAAAADVRDARADFRCVYVSNPGPDPIADVRVSVVARSPGAAGLMVGVDPRPVTYADSMAPQAVAVGTSYGAPAGVGFSTPPDYVNGLPIGDLPAGAGRALWFRRTPMGTAGAAYDAADVTAAGANGDGTVVRRLYWETAPYAQQTNPARPSPNVPTPSPFVRTAVDFLTEEGARTTWDVDPTLVDPGPYTYQLQASQSGIAEETDWVDVGPPVLDAVYLLDNEKRLWGMTPTLHYRVLLTTSKAVYTSPPANVYGKFNREEWLRVREVFRKEQLMLRRFDGVNGFYLKAKRYGQRCSCADEFTGEINNSSCALCYGQGIVGGYHTPVWARYADVGNESTRERVAYNENIGTVRDTRIAARMLALLPVVQRDAWIAVGSDRRYYVHHVREIAQWQGVPVVYSAELRLAPRNDAIYRVPITRPDVPLPSWKVEDRVEI